MNANTQAMHRFNGCIAIVRKSSRRDGSEHICGMDSCVNNNLNNLKMNREQLKQQIVKNFEDAEITEKERITNTMYCIDAHIEHLSIPRVMHWVAVEDKLPKEMEWVLAYDTIGKQVRYMRRIDDLEWQMGRFSIRDVSHWMLIPKPPCV